jgi:predicted metalloprotease with PDZ domain
MPTIARIAWFLLALWALPAFLKSQTMPYAYTLRWGTPNEQTYYLSLTTAASSGPHTDFAVPAWRPGRYMLQNYAAGISHFEALDANGKPLGWQKTNKDTWRVQNPAVGPITVRYRFYANTLDAGSSYLGPDVAYFNPVNFCMYVPGRLDQPATLAIPELPEGWRAATQLRADAQNPRLFHAQDYHDLADAPTILSPNLVQFHFDEGGVRYWLHFYGGFEGTQADQDSCVANVRSIVRESCAIFGGPPADMPDYHFIYYLVPFQFRHAVEHSRSSMYTLPQSVGQNAETLKNIYNITSHEFWHVWNVKRIRPAAMWPYDYSQEQYTELHWWTEGVTDYYTEVIVTRAGVITQGQMLEDFAREITSLENNYANQVVSPAASSFDTWQVTSPYAIPHHRTSFYPQGKRVGLLLDLMLRADTKGKVSLDDVFRHLDREYYQKNRGVPEREIERICQQLAGRDYTQFFADHVYGTAPIDYAKYFNPFGIELETSPSSRPRYQQLGITQLKETAYGWQVVGVTPGTDAFAAGIAAGDMLLRVNGIPQANLPLASVLSQVGPDQTVPIEIFRAGDPAKADIQTLTLRAEGRGAPLNYSLRWAKGGPTALAKAWLKPLVK